MPNVLAACRFVNPPALVLKLRFSGQHVRPANQYVCEIQLTILTRRVSEGLHWIHQYRTESA